MADCVEEIDGVRGALCRFGLFPQMTVSCGNGFHTNMSVGSDSAQNENMLVVR